MTAKDVKKEIQKIVNPEKALFLQRFFKTKEGQYGYGDIFHGLTVPQSRDIAKRFYRLSLHEVLRLLHSPHHEERLISLIILIQQYKNGDEKIKKEIYDIYLANTKWINNWDLVDVSAEHIVGEYLFVHQNESSKILEELAHSQNIWDRRISILATFAFIKNGEYEHTFTIADILLHDTHDLIQKAVGWLLREVGKRISEKAEKEFLNSRYKKMPRTMLRYAIERFSQEERKAYLLGKM